MVRVWPTTLKPTWNSCCSSLRKWWTTQWSQKKISSCTWIWVRLPEIKQAITLCYAVKWMNNSEIANKLPSGGWTWVRCGMMIYNVSVYHVISSMATSLFTLSSSIWRAFNYFEHKLLKIFKRSRPSYPDQNLHLMPLNKVYILFTHVYKQMTLVYLCRRVAYHSSSHVSLVLFISLFMNEQLCFLQ